MMTETDFEYYQRTAWSGDPVAQWYLGMMYENGLGVSPDQQQALRWYLCAAEQGYSDAQLSLALLYAKSEECLQNEQKAVEWFLKVAENGNLIAQELLAKAYERGWFGLPRDPEKARYWRNQAAQNQSQRRSRD